MSDSTRSVSDLPPARKKGRPPKYPDWMYAEARRLHKEGATPTQIAEEFGIQSGTVHYWVTPGEKERRLAAYHEQAEAKRRKKRGQAARLAGGSIAEAYSTIRRHLEALDGAVREAQDNHTRRILREAQGHAYIAEDKIAEALRVS